MTIKILKENPTYRVSDIFFQKGIRWKIDSAEILANTKYEGTILRDFLELLPKAEDIELFRRVVREHQDKYLKPTDNELVVHLRLGDIMDDWANDRCSRQYEDCIKTYKDIHHQLRAFPKLSKATIVTAMHFGANDLNNSYHYSKRAEERSLEVASILRGKLMDNGMSVSIVSNTNIDADLCFMAGSRFFLGGMTQLSRLIARCMRDDTYKIFL